MVGAACKSILFVLNSNFDSIIRWRASTMIQGKVLVTGATGATSYRRKAA